jgi:hypothetical protein
MTDATETHGTTADDVQTVVTPPAPSVSDPPSERPEGQVGAPLVTFRRTGTQVVVSGSYFEPSEMLTVSIRDDERAMELTWVPAFAASVDGTFTVYGRAAEDAEPSVHVTRANFSSVAGQAVGA